MIELYPLPDPRGRKTPPGRPAAHLLLTSPPELATPAQVKAEARRAALAGLGSHAWRAVDLLASGGVLPVNRIPGGERNVQRWSQNRIVDRLSISPDDLQAACANVGLKLTPPLYVLGPVGVEIAAQRWDVAPPTGYPYYSLQRVLHDVIVNEVVLRLAERLGGQGWTVEWLGKYEATLTDKDHKHTLLEPDALLRCRKEERELAFAIEYHNEDWQTRAVDKIARYETARKEGNWVERWEVEQFPPVLAVFWKAVVGSGYKNAIQARKNRREEVNCAYYGKTLQAVWDGKLGEWFNVASDKKEALPGLAEGG